jgi:DNA-directed RNA polymerase subunit E'/Rpb7
VSVSKKNSLSAKDAIEQRARRLDVDIMYEHIKELAERGLRCDLTPTLMHLNDPMKVAEQMYAYLKRQDEYIRKEAQRTLDEVAEARERISEVHNPVI